MQTMPIPLLHHPIKENDDAWAFNSVSEQYCLSSDHDDRWRTGGTLDEVLDEAHMSPKWVLEAIRSFAMDRDKRLATLSQQLASANNSKIRNYS
jgi:transketolase